MEFISTDNVMTSKLGMFSKKCQCCFSTTNLKSMVKSFVYNGKTEVYSEMLSFCFSIEMVYQGDADDPYQICENCIIHLREGCIFKKQVQDVQLSLQEELCSSKSLGVLPNIGNHLEDDYSEHNTTYSDCSKSDNEPLNKHSHKNTISFKSNTPDLTIPNNSKKSKKRNTIGVKVIKRKIIVKKIENMNNDLIKSEILSNQGYNDNTEKSHHDVQLQLCSICNKYVKGYKLKKHIRGHSWNNIQHKCPTCPQKQFASFHSLIKHSTKVHNLQNFKCEYCSGMFIVAKEFLRHVRTCYICHDGMNNLGYDEDSTPLSWLKPKLEHIDNKDTIIPETVVIKEEIFINNLDTFQGGTHYDNEQFVQKIAESNSQENEKEKTDAWKKAPGVKTIKPKISTRPKVNWKNMSREEYKRRRVMQNKVRLLKEVPIHLDDTVKVCHVCGEEFSTHTYLRKHLSIHFPNYICYHCGRPFARRSGLKSHLLSHDDTMVSCEICNKVMKKSSMYRHIGIHTGNSDIYKCPSCPLTFKAWTNRMEHMKQAHNVQGNIYKCKICSQEFRSSSILNMHIRKIHLNERRFSCSVCDKRFFAKAQLDDHFRHHSGERFKCNICSKCYIRKSKLMSHMRLHSATEQQSVGIFT